jgi:PiT family inorganic phosphate transporter
MLILIGAAPTAYALNRTMPDSSTPAFLADRPGRPGGVPAHAGGAPPCRPSRRRARAPPGQRRAAHPPRSTTRRSMPPCGADGRHRHQVKSYGAIKPRAGGRDAQRAQRHVSGGDAMRAMGAKQGRPKGSMPADAKATEGLPSGAGQRHPLHSDLGEGRVALALGLGTMVGWKRIVVTVGEKIGKTHLTYAQGASAEIVAAATIGRRCSTACRFRPRTSCPAAWPGPWRPTARGCNGARCKNIALAWVLTLPAAMLIAGGQTFAACSRRSAFEHEMTPP